ILTDVRSCVRCRDLAFCLLVGACFFFSSRRRHTRFSRDWSSDVCSSDLGDQREGGEAYGLVTGDVFDAETRATRALFAGDRDMKTDDEGVSLLPSASCGGCRHLAAVPGLWLHEKLSRR